MLVPGLVSITFRALPPQEIIRVVSEAGLQSIEWGGDIHVPPGDIRRARQVGAATRDAGLMVAAYGSYFRLGNRDASAPRFEDVLASAKALGAPTIRVWAGKKGSADSSPEERRAVIDDALRVADIAGRRGIAISLEYHGGTLTDSRASVLSLMDELDHPNIDFLWQPTNGESVEACAMRLLDVLPRLRNVHVFHWWPTDRERHPLSLGEAAWRTYIEVVRASGRDVDFLLEFVLNDSPAQFFTDAATLRGFLR
jgi:3-dehydroshikimate dehydratase